MSSTIIVLLAGIPGAGKTTFSKHFQKLLPHYNTKIFHYDELCVTFSAYERSLVLKKIENYVKVLEDTETKNIIVIDDNNYYKSMRKEYVQLCRSYKLGLLIIYFKISLETAIQKNRLRIGKAKVKEDTIKKMFRKLEVPIEKTNVIHIEYKDSFDIGSIESNIQFAFNNPEVQQVQEPKQLHCDNRLQQIDLLLRKIVGRLIKQDPSKAKEYNKTKKHLYEAIKTNQLLVRNELELNQVESILITHFPAINLESVKVYSTSQELIEKPVETISTISNITKPEVNEIQRIDLILRRIVNQKSRANPSKASEYNKIRKTVFNDLKKKCVLTPNKQTSNNEGLESELSKYFN